MLELMPHTPMLDTHTLTDTTDTLLVLLTLLARDLLMLKLKLSQKLGMVLMDTHMPELTHTELTHMPMELTLSARDPPMLKLSQKLGMVLMDMDMLHTATVTPDTHTLMDTESRLVKFLENHYINSSYQQSFIQNLWNLKMSKFQNKPFVKLYKTVIKKTKKNMKKKKKKKKKKKEKKKKKKKKKK